MFYTGPTSSSTRSTPAMTPTARTTSSARRRARTHRTLLWGTAGALLLALFCFDGATGQTGKTEPLGIGMEGYDYPFPVQHHTFRIEGKRVRMAYMDVRPDGQVRGNVVLFHGKNFFGGYWEPTIRHLRTSGYRVIAPDQIGFGKSTKPLIDYGFHRLAWLTHRLLEELEVEETAVVGHSMGGMLATRFALMYPATTTKLTLENPIGLEDYRRKVPYVPTRAITEAILGKTESGIRSDFKTYFTEWRPSYERFVQVHYRWTLSPEYPRFARVSAETAQMIYEQPVVHQLGQLEVPTLLVIGQEDRTALGAGRVADSVRATLGQYPELGERAAERIPNARLVELDGIGHIPHLAATDRFHEALTTFLAD